MIGNDSPNKDDPNTFHIKCYRELVSLASQSEQVLGLYWETNGDVKEQELWGFQHNV